MTASRRILFVPPRYGPDIVGGAENLLRGLATASHGAGQHVEVATTCAIDSWRWSNAMAPGVVTEHGIRVHRFPVERGRPYHHQRLLERLDRAGTLTDLDAADLFATSVWSSGLQRFIDTEGTRFDAIVFAPYLLGTTFWGAQSWPERTIVAPCLHDEPLARLEPVRRVLSSVAGLAFNSRGERALGEQILGPIRGHVVGLGFEAPAVTARGGFAERHGLDRYFLYAGRVEEGKRVDVAARYVASLARSWDPQLRLAVIGSGPWRPSGDTAPFVHTIGFVNEEEKRSAMAGAIALVNPSESESLSIVLLEAWLEGTPALVAAGSAVMADHCARSGGGATFSNEEAFAVVARRLAEAPDVAREMGRRGHDYVLREYGRDAVTQRFHALVDEVRGPRPG